MHLHPQIHSELIRQHELDLSRRTVRAPLTSDRARRSMPSDEGGEKIRSLIIAKLAMVGLR